MLSTLDIVNNVPIFCQELIALLNTIFLE